MAAPEVPQGLDVIIAVMQDRLLVLEDEAARLRRAIAELNGASPTAIARSLPRPSTPPSPQPLSSPQAQAPSAASSLSGRREEIVADVQAHPNSNKDDIAKRLGSSPAAVAKHLRSLVAEGAIQQTGGAGRYPYVYSAVAGAAVATKPAAKRKHRARLNIVPGSRLDKTLADIRAHAGATTKEISDRTGIDQTSVTKLLGQLREANFIESVKPPGRNQFSRHTALSQPSPGVRPASAPGTPSRAERILADIQAHPDTIGREIAERTGLMDTEVYNLARKLEDDGKIVRDAKPGNQPSTFRAAPATPEPAPATTGAM